VNHDYALLILSGGWRNNGYTRRFPRYFLLTPVDARNWDPARIFSGFAIRLKAVKKMKKFHFKFSL